VGLLVFVAESPQFYELLGPIRFVYAVPLGTLVYELFLAPSPSREIWLVFGLGYLVMYAAVVWFALRDGPSTSQRGLLKLFFAGNAIAYAALPLLFVNSQVMQYYTSGDTLPTIAIYGLLMGAMYFGVGQPSESTTETRDRGRSRSTAGAEPNRDTSRGGRSEPAEARRTQSKSAASSANRSPERAQQAPPKQTADGPNRGRETREQRAGSPERTPRQDTRSTEARAKRQPRREETRDTGHRSEDPDSTRQRSQAPTQSEQSRSRADERAVDRDDSTDRDDGGDEGDGNELVDLFERLTSPDRDERLAAAERIGKITWDDPSAVAAEPLAEAIDTEQDAEVREALVVAIGSIDSEAAEDALKEARFDPNPNVSSRASNLLQ
jgi:hypothetical protein